MTADRPSNQDRSAASGSQPAGTSAPSVNTSAPRERLVTMRGGASDAAVSAAASRTRSSLNR